jgi:hypothetical protein
MSFKSTYKPAYARDFVSKEEKDSLIEHRTPFEITKVRTGAGDYGKQFFLSIIVVFEGEEEPVEKTMTFSAESNVFTRDDLLEQLMAYLKDNPGESQIAYLIQQGQTKLIELEDDGE